MKRSMKLLCGLLLCCLMLFLLPTTAEAATQASGTCGEKLTWTLSDDGTLTISGSGAMTEYPYPSAVPWYQYYKSIKAVKMGSKVTTISPYAFYICGNMASIDISNSVTTIGKNAFYGCNSLTSIVIPDSVKSIGDNAFQSCDRLVRVTIGDGVETIGKNAFIYCDMLTSVTLGDSVKTIGDYAFLSCSALMSIDIPNSVTTIGAGAFSQCEKMTDARIGSGVTSIGSQAFAYCHALTSITIPNSVKELGTSAFNYCENATSISIGNGITEIPERAFFYCNSASSLKFGSKVTSIGDEAFRDCDKLTSVVIPSTVTNIGIYAFAESNALTSVTVSGKATIGRSAFNSCTALTDVSLNNKITTIGNYAFYGCKSLTSIVLPDALTQIGSDTFDLCSSLTKVIMSDSIAYIAGSAFDNCSSLVTVAIPDSVTSISNNAFNGCGKLDYVYFGGDAVSMGDYTFSSEINCYYPEGNTTWTSGYLTNHGGTLTWGTYKLPVGPKLSVSNTTTGQIKLSWDKVSGAVRYNVYRATSKNGTYKKIASTTSTTLTNTSAEAGKTYYYKVRVITSNGVFTEYSNIVKGVNLSCGTPTVSSSNVASSGKIKLTWNKVTGAANYQVYRATSKTGTYKLMKTTTDTSYINTSAEAGKTYYYYVVAVSEAGYKSEVSNTTYRTCDLPSPVVSVSNVSSTGKNKVSWGAIDGAVNYKVYRSTSKTGTYSLIKTTTSISYTDTTAKAGTLYYYKVVAVAEKTTANSSYSSYKSRTCDLPRPVVSIALKDGKPRLTWKAIDGAIEYRVYRATSQNGTYTLMKTTTSTSYTNTSAKSGTTYYYKVIAVHSNSAANSAYSLVDYIKSK